jgi:hypothetical protein
MMSRTSEGQSWREAADGEEEDSTVQGGCGNEVRNDVLETDKRPGAKAREGALNRVEKIKGKKRGSTGEGHESDTRQDKEEGERMEQESSRQHTHKHARMLTPSRQCTHAAWSMVVLSCPFASMAGINRQGP